MIKNNEKKSLREENKDTNNLQIKILKNLKNMFIGAFDSLMFILKTLIYFILLAGFAWWNSLEPSLILDWEESESILSEIDFSKEKTEGIISIKNIRNFKYKKESDPIVGYYNETYDLNKLEKVYFIVEPFSNFNGPAHTMLSFEFSDGKYLVISAEIRKEKGESFDPFLGILNQYEIVYILGDEKDLIRLRTNIRDDDVILYPINIKKEKVKDIFLSALHRADKLSKEPEFYNTIWNSCITNIVKHVNSVIPYAQNKVSILDWNILLPANSDEIAYYKGWIDTTLSLNDARDYYNITPIAKKIDINDMEFSEKIRNIKKFKSNNKEKILNK